MFNLSQPLAHLEASFYLEGTEYKVEKFSVGFSQAGDYKGQPQHEVKGGQITLCLAQIADENLFMWAKKSTMLKSGSVVFQTDLGKRVLSIDFVNGYCVNLTRELNALTGNKTSLIISPESITVDEIKHENRWKK